MKVALAFPGCYRRGGVERVMLETTNFLASRGHDTHAFAIEWEQNGDAVDARAVRHTLPIRSQSYLPRLWRFIRDSRVEIKRLNPNADVLAGFGIEAPLDSVIWMQSVHRAWLEASGMQRALKGRIKQRLNPAHPVILALEKHRFTHRRYRRVIALSPQVQSDIVRFYGVPQSDITVVPNGFSPAEFSISARRTHRDRMRNSLGFKPSDRVVVFVANEVERKGLVPLMRAIASLRDPSIHLLAVGRLDSTSCSMEVTALGLEGRVHWTGSSNAVAELYAAADLFALPTQYEAWGLVIVEAMACGLPVVVSRLAGASVAVKENTTGVLLDTPSDPVEIAAGISKLFSGPIPDAEEVSKSVEEYAWDTVLQRYEMVLLESQS